MDSKSLDYYCEELMLEGGKNNSTKKKKKKGLMSKTWERCKSLSSGIGTITRTTAMKSSQSWPRNLTMQADCYGGSAGSGNSSMKRVAPDGFLSVYVGEERRRFVIKTEYVNHALFKSLLDEAESEYGFSSEGPLVLPCEEDHFMQVLTEMESDDDGGGGGGGGCSNLVIMRSHSSSSAYQHLIAPPRQLPSQYTHYCF